MNRKWSFERKVITIAGWLTRGFYYLHWPEEFRKANDNNSIDVRPCVTWLQKLVSKEENDIDHPRKCLLKNLKGGWWCQDWGIPFYTKSWYHSKEKEFTQHRGRSDHCGSLLLKLEIKSTWFLKWDRQIKLSRKQQFQIIYRTSLSELSWLF